ncbi:MAG: Energy-dependent translational throttle protein EttA [Phycisphaerae bacterium]|nr:Energy-dependent translational throttle protein EttA [Phycisphaerae bacterium]
MGVIRLQQISKQYGPKWVLQNVDLELQTGEVVGLVGANGSGKTTLFNLICRQVVPDGGEVIIARDLQIGLLTQNPDVDPQRTVHEEVTAVFADLAQVEQRLHAVSEAMAATPPGPALDPLLKQYDLLQTEYITRGGYTIEQRLQTILAGLGFAPRDLNLPVGMLSGGQRCRVALAKLLLQEQQFLLLDEPTNHLDIDAVRWLEKFLAGFAGGAVVISHDRYLLDRIASRIVEVERRRVYSYPGNYTHFIQTRELRELTQLRQYEKDQEFIAKEREFIARFLAGQRSQEAQGRRTRLERRIANGEFVMEPPIIRQASRFQFAPNTLTDRIVLETENLSKRYDDKMLFHELNLQLRSGERLGITGPNGTGKSTLLKILLGLIRADSGQYTIDGKVQVGYYAQDTGEFEGERTILEEIRSARAGLTEEQARSYLGRFLFSGEDVFKSLRQLSGGEHSRVRLVKLMLATPHLLILDEPTNHLDIPSREALETALSGYPGALLVVSHDRYFLDRIASRLLVLRHGHHHFHNGNYTSYIQSLEQEISRKVQDTAAKPARRKSAPPSAATVPKNPFARYNTERLEELIMELEEEIVEMTGRFGDPSISRDPQALAALQTAYDQARHDLQLAEAEWSTR